MPQTLTAATDEFLKRQYTDKMADLLNNSNVLTANLSKLTDVISADGYRTTWLVRSSRNTAVGALAEGDTIGTAGRQGAVQAFETMRTMYAQIELTQQVMAASKTSAGSYAKMLDTEIKGSVRDLARDIERQLHGDGSGRLATTGTTTALTTITLDSATELRQLRFLEEGVLIDIGTLANPVSRATGRTITAVNRTAKTITISGAAVTTAPGEFIFRSGAGPINAGADNRELNGLLNLVSNQASLHGVSSATVPKWTSYVGSNTGALRTPNEVLFGDELDNIYQESGEYPDMGICQAGVLSAYSASLLSQKRFTNTVDLKGGFKGTSVDYGNAHSTLTSTRDCQGGRVYWVNTKGDGKMALAEWQKGEWMSEDGAVLRKVNNKVSYEATYVRFFNPVVASRNSHGVTTDLSATKAA